MPSLQQDLVRDVAELINLGEYAEVQVERCQEDSNRQRHRAVHAMY